jgi:hypothetical protein
MTIFQLSVLPDRELQALALKAQEEEANAKLSRTEREAAAATLYAIALCRAMIPKP